MAELPAPTPITEWPDYNVMPTGGDVMTQDLNALYDKGDLCWLLVSTVLCWYVVEQLKSPQHLLLTGAGRSHPQLAFCTLACIDARPP